MPQPDGKLKPRPEIRPAKVRKPTYNENDNTLMVPLIPLNALGTHVTATICYVAMKYGYTITELRERYHLPATWTKKAILRYIEKYGLYEFPEGYYDRW
jgi:hypothetical protein